MNLRNDRWLEPPDEPEAMYCESCGKEMVECDPMEFYCKNSFCPEKFVSTFGKRTIEINVAKEMAEKIVELEDDNTILKDELRWANGHKKQFLEEINTLKEIIKKLTQGQTNVVVRDTDYQIRRMEDAIEYVKDPLRSDDYAILWKEWMEVKKILQEGE